MRKGGGITLGTHTVGAGVEEVLNTGDPREHMVKLGSDALWWSMGKELPEMKTIVDVQQSAWKELEGLLRGAAERLGVTFIEESVTSGNALMALHPRAVAIIGADGRHSMLRETLLVRADTVSGTRGEHEP